MSIFDMLFCCNSSILLKKHKNESINSRFKELTLTKQNRDNAGSLVNGYNIEIIASSLVPEVNKSVLENSVEFKHSCVEVAESFAQADDYVKENVDETTQFEENIDTMHRAEYSSPDGPECNRETSTDIYVPLQDCGLNAVNEIIEEVAPVYDSSRKSLSVAPLQSQTPTITSTEFITAGSSPTPLGSGSLKNTSVYINKTLDDIISPTQHDTLFWCIYIAAFGYNDYLQIDRNYGVKELEIKKKVCDSIQASPNQLKQTNYKITKVAIQEIMSDFLTCQKETSMLCLIAIICHFKMNIVMVDSTNKLMLEFLSLPDITLPTYVLYKDTYGKYKIKTTPIFQDEIALMKSTMICLENYIKPLKPISTYKLEDLVELAKKMGVYNETEKRKKTELYEQINNIMLWR